MQGVFGAGVVTALERENCYDAIEAVYSTSAGSLVGAYFLARQSGLGSSIYLEDLSRGFISPRRFFLGIYDRLYDHYIRYRPRDTWRNAIDIEYLFDIVAHKKPLAIDVLNKQDIPLFVKLINLHTRRLEYHDVRGAHAVTWLRAAVDVMPYTTELQYVDGVPYADAGIKEVIGIDTLVARHPHNPIVIVLNSHERRRISHVLKNKVEGYFVSITGAPDLAPPFYSAEKRLRAELVRIQAMEQVYLWAIPEQVQIRSRTTSKLVLEQTYKAGIRAGMEIVEQIRTLQMQ